MKRFLLSAALLAALGLGAPTNDPRDSLMLRSDVPGLNVTNLVNPESAGPVDDPDHREIGIAVASNKAVFTGNHTDIYDEYWRALDWLCPYEHEQSCHLNSLDKDGFLRGDKWVYTVNDENKRWGYVEVWVERGLYASDQIRRLMIGSIAGTIQAWHSLAENCFKNDESWGGHGCSIPNYIGLRLEDTVNVIDVHFMHSKATEHLQAIARKPSI